VTLKTVYLIFNVLISTDSINLIFDREFYNDVPRTIKNALIEANKCTHVPINDAWVVFSKLLLAVDKEQTT